MCIANFGASTATCGSLGAARRRDDIDVDFRRRALARPEPNAEIEHQTARGSTVLVETWLALGGRPATL